MLRDELSALRSLISEREREQLRIASRETIPIADCPRVEREGEDGLTTFPVVTPNHRPTLFCNWLGYAIPFRHNPPEAPQDIPLVTSRSREVIAARRSRELLREVNNLLARERALSSRLRETLAVQPSHDWERENAQTIARDENEHIRVNAEGMNARTKMHGTIVSVRREGETDEQEQAEYLGQLIPIVGICYIRANKRALRDFQFALNANGASAWIHQEECGAFIVLAPSDEAMQRICNRKAVLSFELLLNVPAPRMQQAPEWIPSFLPHNAKRFA